MAKRKFQNNEDEEGRDHDYQDDQSPDHDPEPSSGDNHEEGPSRRTDRVLRSDTSLTAPRPGPRYNEEDEDIGDDENDATFEDNTDAGDPKASEHESKPSGTTRSARVRKTGPTKYCGVITAFIKEPKKANRTTGDFVCPICESKFTRKEGVNYHFPGCVEIYGNPQGKRWNDHPSCSGRDSAHKEPASKKQTIEMVTSRSSGHTRPQAQPRLIIAATGTRKPRTRQAASTAEKQSPPPKAIIPVRPQTTRSKSTLKAQTKTQVAAGKTPTKKTSGTATKTRKPVPETGRARRRGKFQIDMTLPPLSDLKEIFHDLVSRAWNELLPAPDAFKDLSGKEVHVATMCSGTESPLLAMYKMQEGLRVSGRPTFNIKHRFSAEIVPYKQAYIERNFHPEKIFRDIREIGAGGRATTAYGALTTVPDDVDILIAGFSCVDFSKLNRKGKKLTDTGESGDTFRAILEYAKKYRPAVVILENVDGAPWDFIKAIWEKDVEIVQEHMDQHLEKGCVNEQGSEPVWDEDDPGYSAMWHKVDAKHYYIPHTRTRRYMICLDRLRFTSPEAADDAVKSWTTYMVALERNASVNVEAFLLSDDDPRLQRAKDELSKVPKSRRERNWEVCNGRHEAYRSSMKLGTGRPVLHWTNDGAVKPSTHIWTEWTLSQVERVWDSIEVSYLRNAAIGFDSFFKSRFWELSQNIDRFTDKTPAGVIGCLTPSGQPFSTIRGRPITGLEALALQGLPVDTLLLTRESQSELQDFAGNAMTSTVVGAALLSALIVSHKVLTRTKKSASQPHDYSSSNSKEMNLDELHPGHILTFDETAIIEPEDLSKMAKASSRLCHCEGQSLIAIALIRKCESCHYRCCEKCGNLPKHNYQLLGENEAPPRLEPREFQKLVSCAIPSRLQIWAWETDYKQELSDQKGEDWELFREAFYSALEQEYRYESAKRSSCWTFTYDSAVSKLELIFDQEDIYWLLYGKPEVTEAGGSRVRYILEQPLARLTVRGKNMQGDLYKSDSLLDGCWEMRRPVNRTFAVSISPQGRLTDSWEKTLGLEDEPFLDKQVFTSLQVAPISDSASVMNVDHRICGTYDLLEQCGTASSSLHKKREATDNGDAPLFLFLDPDRNGPSTKDSYVFSKHIQKLEYGEKRHFLARVDSKWRPPYKNSQGYSTGAKKVVCTVFGQWTLFPLQLKPYKEQQEMPGEEPGEEPALASSKIPKGDISMPVFGNHELLQPSAKDTYGCLHEAATTALLSCEVPGQIAQSVCWQFGHWTIVDQKSERQVAAAFAWLFTRVRDLGGFEGDWRSLDPCPNGYRNCSVCAPEPPKIMWTISRSTTKKKDNTKKNDTTENDDTTKNDDATTNNDTTKNDDATTNNDTAEKNDIAKKKQTARKNKIIPYEDGREAGRFERRIKARPAPFLVETSLDADKERTGRLRVGIHLPTLVHRALATLGQITDSDDVEIKWRLDTRFEAPTRYKLREFTLTNNMLTVQAEYDFPTGEKLRPDQKRSLHWMIGQEANDMAFYEEEIEEATLSQLGWRAEACVRRARSVRGGVLADEVGYGKTATTLALIDALKENAEEYAKIGKHGCIFVKATLILVPPHLVHQWKGQAQKFLGIASNNDEILVIENMNDLVRISIERIRKAIIVIASWSIMSSTAYLARMSHFAALPQGPSSGEREIDAWLSRACGKIKKHVRELVYNPQGVEQIAEELKTRLKEAHNDKDILRDIPTQRLKGAKYNTWNPAERVTPQDHAPTDDKLKGYFKHMKNCKDLKDMTGTLLHMFDFYRIVVDEYTYVDSKAKAEKISSFITSVNARSRWVLSGTPMIQDFGDVRNLARFLAYNLGVVDDTAGVVKGATIRRIRENRTAAEQFNAFGYSHTAAWHINRQAHAQRFLNKYASKNVAQIAPIECKVHFRPQLLGTIESILNAELQQQLQSTDMTIILRGKTKEDNDRVQRYKALLKGCNTASECLLKACSCFDSISTRPADPASVVAEDFEAMINVREKQMESLVVELESKLLQADWLVQQCRRAKEKKYQGPHFPQWQMEIDRNTLGDLTVTSELQRYIDAAFQSVDDDIEERYYRDAPTKAQLAKEKKAEQDHKKSASAKKSKAKKAKKTGKSSQKANETVQADDIEPYLPDLRANKIGRDDAKGFNDELRRIIGHLRHLAKELTSRTRSLRFSRGAYTLYQSHTNGGGLLTCVACDDVVEDYNKISINIGCGHLTCEKCIQTNANKNVNAVCAVEGCSELSEPFCRRTAADLAGDGETRECGSKLSNIIALINSLPKDEQVLLFVQFEDLMLKISDALEAANISNYSLHKQQSKEMNRIMNDFQENQGADKRKVLILDASSESAAGINLTNTNHVIFVSPLLTKSQQTYDASMTQSIGRAKRFGQRKTVHVYRFLALGTIDVDILQERERKKLVKAAEANGCVGGNSDEIWGLVEEDQIDRTMEGGGGSGYDFKSNPMEHDD